ncbi:prokineticin domain-containing protein [Caerostris darwini]|uniref:Prokineticin domain-containing protein n=1 Tax=Caerostris darwini TaxID=1538125 RepID=A0AAV4T6R1_9ARAC|nr:prokineticin domain-containing protein [Caerostris darwini]
MKWMVLALVVASAACVLATNRCKSAEDCEEGECCVNYVIVTLFGGHCRKMREEGESCTPLVRESNKNPDMYHFQCPCKEGLECIAQHELKIGDHVIRHRPECVVPGNEGDEDEVTEETPFPDPDAE